MKIRTFWLNLGWLVVLVVTVAVPLGLDAAGRLNYFTSLALWGIPILDLWPSFNMLTALILWRVNGNFPTYFAFLAAGALLPAMFLYRAIGNLTNWPAFAVTTLYVMVTSLIWEVTLAIPRQWWG